MVTNTTPREGKQRTLPCGCQAGRLCPIAREISRRVAATYGHAQATGQWGPYDLAREVADAHLSALQGED